MVDPNARQGRNRPATTSEKRIGLGFCVLLLILLLCAACTAINVHQAPPKDWPKLTVGVVKTGFWNMQTYCGTGGLMFLVQQSLACAVINFNDMTCTIFYAADDDTGLMAIEHEELHCLGHDHIGSSQLADAWKEFKSQNRRAGK